jgi:hypothetical protein
MTFPFIVGLPWLAFAVVIFSVSVFPSIPASFGGGAPVLSQLLADADKSSHLTQLGIAVSPWQSTTGALLTEPVMLLDETTDRYFLLVAGNNSSFSGVALDKNIVRAVLFPPIVASRSVTNTTSLPMSTQVPSGTP